MRLSQNFLQKRRLESLVENQTSYTLNAAALHVFETHQQAEKVQLSFDQPTLASMISGKKVMHLRDMNPFDFLPGESVMLPSNELMCIDFPEAQMKNPTRCLALTISEERINQIISRLNETNNKENGEWTFHTHNFHFSNEETIQHIIRRLMFLFTENHKSKEVFVDFAIQELIIRILQIESQKNYRQNTLQLRSSHRLAFVVDYIRNHLDQKLTVSKLSKMAYMSESNFHRVFKNELMISPTEFIIQERIHRASSLLQDPTITVKEAHSRCGFNSLSHFNSLFKRIKGVSPRAYQQGYKQVAIPDASAPKY